jgi:drug/metabolite transporter (DMT)-like permease
MSWFYLALLAPLLYAVINLIDDNLLHYVYDGPYMATVIAGLFGAIPLFTLFFLHYSAISAGLAILAILAGFLTTSYLFFYFKALEIEQPSVVIALFSLAPATLPFLAHFILRENLAHLQIIGLIVVLGGSFLLAATDIKKFKFSGALVPILIAVILVDTLSLISKHVYENANFYAAFMWVSAGMGLGGIYFLLVMHYSKTASKFKRLRKKLVRFIPILLIAELINLAAGFTLNLAISRGPVSNVKVIEGIQPVFVLLIALALYPLAPKLFREAKGGKLAWKLSLMTVIIIGLVLIQISS